MKINLLNIVHNTCVFCVSLRTSYRAEFKRLHELVSDIRHRNYIPALTPEGLRDEDMCRTRGKMTMKVANYI